MKVQVSAPESDSNATRTPAPVVMTDGATLNTFLVEEQTTIRSILVEAMETLTTLRFVGVHHDRAFRPAMAAGP
jgi:hypothetical protein